MLLPPEKEGALFDSCVDSTGCESSSTMLEPSGLELAVIDSDKLTKAHPELKIVKTSLSTKIKNAQPSLGQCQTDGTVTMLCLSQDSSSPCQPEIPAVTAKLWHKIRLSSNNTVIMSIKVWMTWEGLMYGMETQYGVWPMSIEAIAKTFGASGCGKKKYG